MSTACLGNVTCLLLIVRSAPALTHSCDHEIERFNVGGSRYALIWAQVVSLFEILPCRVTTWTGPSQNHKPGPLNPPHIQPTLGLNSHERAPDLPHFISSTNMPCYAILGATGSVGSSILKVLLQSPDQPRIHAYCRSKQKLAKLCPASLENKRVTVFEGSLDDNDLLADCLRDTRAAFLAVAVTGNKPGNTLALDTARQVVSSLERLRDKEPSIRLPKLVVLSSASTEHRLMSATPHFLLNLLYCANFHIYNDLKEAEKFIRSKDWIAATFIKPGALSVDEQRGHVLNLTEAKSPVSFLDLAAGMIEAADEEQYDGKAVAVNATGSVAFPWQAPGKLSRGLLCYFFPLLYPYLG